MYPKNEWVYLSKMQNAVSNYIISHLWIKYCEFVRVTESQCHRWQRRSPFSTRCWCSFLLLVWLPSTRIVNFVETTIIILHSRGQNFGQNTCTTTIEKMYRPRSSSKPPLATTPLLSSMHIWNKLTEDTSAICIKFRLVSELRVWTACLLPLAPNEQSTQMPRGQCNRSISFGVIIFVQKTLKTIQLIDTTARSIAQEPQFEQLHSTTLSPLHTMIRFHFNNLSSRFRRSVLRWTLRRNRKWSQAICAFVWPNKLPVYKFM